MKKNKIFSELLDAFPVLLIPAFYLFLRSNTYRSIETIHYNYYEFAGVIFLFCLGYYFVEKLKNGTIGTGLSAALMMIAWCIVPVSIVVLFPVLMLYIAKKRNEKQLSVLAELSVLFALSLGLSEGIYFCVLNINYNLFSFKKTEVIPAAVIFVINVAVFCTVYLMLRNRKALHQTTKRGKKNRNTKAKTKRIPAGVYKTLAWMLFVLTVAYCIRSGMLYDIYYIGLAVWVLFIVWYLFETNQTFNTALKGVKMRMQKVFED